LTANNKTNLENLFGLDEPELELMNSFPPPPPAGIAADCAGGSGRRPPPVPPPVPTRARKALQGPLKVRSGMLGSILVDNELLTPAQRDDCLRMQSRPDSSAPFGEIAVRLGYLSPEVLAKVLEAQKRYVSSVREEQSVAVPIPDGLLELEEDEDGDAGEDVARMHGWLRSAMKHGASDLHLMSGKTVTLRRHGHLVGSRDAPLAPDAVARYLRSLLTDEEKGALDRDGSVTKCVDLEGGGRARACIFSHMRGTNGVFRLIPDQAPSLTALNLPPAVGKFTAYTQGLVLVTGPIGCGKTTTLAALVDIINRERNLHIICVEDPIEHLHRNKASLVTQRQVGRHTGSFVGALRAALREDPDIIVVGEMRDKDTAQLAVSAAETGHLVFATLHTQSAIRSINRVLDLFPAQEQGQVRAMLAESLRGVISQQLVPRADVPGLVPVTELLFVSPAVRNLIRDNKIHQIGNVLSISREAGNLSVREHADELLRGGLIDGTTHARVLAQ
jgi:twitching motility protein PilT